MYLRSTLVALSLFLATSLALPPPPHRRLFESITDLDDVLLFDAPAFQDPADPTKLIAGLQAFVSLRAFDTSKLLSGVEDVLGSIGIDIGDQVDTVAERLSLFAAIGLPGKEVEVNVAGCDTPAVMKGTSGIPDLGMATQNVSIGSCSNGRVLKATALADGIFDNREFTANVYVSPPDGFGVISDVDDTIKVSNVLDKLALARSTLLEEAKPVDGMPELYQSLATSLNRPAFFYVSGSPFQLYPFLHEFIETTYPQGPLVLQNLTVFDVQGLLNFAGSDGVQEYKVKMIDRIVGMYPAKKFLAIGDSTQRDPETYAEAFKKYPDLIACTWIRTVQGANNTAERFAEAFAGVPKGKFRVFKDEDIASLASINVASGEC